MRNYQEGVNLKKLPWAVARLTDEVIEIKSLLLQQASMQPTETDCWFNLHELFNYLPVRPSKQTVYCWAHDRIIPFHMGSKKLRFLKAEIDAWLLDDWKKIHVQLLDDPGSYLQSLSSKINVPQ